MVVVYGDYKDLNYVGDFFKGAPKSLHNEMEMDFLYPYWEKFIKCEYNFEEKQISEEEWKSHIWIDIRNIIFRENEYTSYGIVSPSPFRPFKEWDTYDAKYMDKIAGIVVTEKLISEDGFNPTFNEVRRREIMYGLKYNASNARRWKLKKSFKWFVEDFYCTKQKP